ncbi:hypothetical protein Mapa_017486 [Marchantia paleacea]|nr:hypothetical protein Mapa_017486 [Marchantia paleacea]
MSAHQISTFQSSFRSYRSDDPFPFLYKSQKIRSLIQTCSDKDTDTGTVYWRLIYLI